jgi:hypothetical protein
METAAKIKQGDTFVLPCAYTPGGAPASIAALDIRAHIKTRTGQPVGEFTVNRIDEAGGLYELDSGDTSGWPVGDLITDIRYTAGSASIATDTFRIVVGVAITPRGAP